MPLKSVLAGLLLFNNLWFWLRLILEFTDWFVNTSFPTIDTAIIRSSRLVLFCKRDAAKRMFLKISQNLQENTKKKKRFQLRCFYVNSGKFLITSDDCFGINIPSIYYPTMNFRIFKNDVTHIFWLSIF